MRCQELDGPLHGAKFFVFRIQSLSAGCAVPGVSTADCGAGGCQKSSFEISKLQIVSARGRAYMSILFDHHIIPGVLQKHEAFRDIDPQLFDIDAPGNRIYLPADAELAADMKLSRHPGGHVDPYFEAVDKALEKIKETGDAGARAEEIKILIDAMRVGFANGDLHTNIPMGKTLEDVKNGIEKVFTDHKRYLAERPDQLQEIRDLEHRAAALGLDHLVKWSAIVGNAERERLLSEAIARDRGVNITAGNRDLVGTPWSKSAAAGPNLDNFPTPGFTSLGPREVPTVPGSTIPSVDWLNKREEYLRSDPRLIQGLPAFPAIDPTTNGLGPLPPSVATRQDPLVLQFNPETGSPLTFSDGAPVMGPAPSNNGTAFDKAALFGTAAAGAAFLAPQLLPLLPLLLGPAVLPAAKAGAANSVSGGIGNGAATSGGGVFSTGAPPYNAFNNGQPSADGYSSGISGSQQTGAKPLDQEPFSAVPFTDRFGNWTETPVGTVPAQASAVLAPPSAGTSLAVAPEDVRRLTRVNASNSANAFTSGAPPVPYLPSSEFDRRFGNWSASPRGGPSQQASRPVGLFADEPSYLIPPPIWGLEDQSKPRNDAGDWFSRWIEPLLRQD